MLFRATGLARPFRYNLRVRFGRGLSFCAALAIASPAAAADTWSTPHTGMKRLHRQTSNQNINALVVDLCAAGVSLRATAASEKGQKTSAFASKVGAQAAINGDFFGGGYAPNGLAVHAGQSWGAADHGYVGPLAFGANRADLIAHEVVAAPEPWMQEIVSGHPTILWKGAPRNNNGDPLCSNRHPRTVVGLSQDRRQLVLAVVDGRAPTRIGMTCDELTALMQELGAHDAMNLDGGGSSTMWLSGSVINMPSDAGGERTVGNHLAVFAVGSGAAASCPVPAYRAEFVATGGWPGAPMQLSPGQVVSGYLELKNTGQASWTPGVTKLGTTEPRDRESPVATSNWLNPGRAATVKQLVAPGETARFEFEVRAPDTPGVYLEHFGLVEEAVSWFADSGGPPDSALSLSVESLVGTGGAFSGGTGGINAGGWGASSGLGGTGASPKQNSKTIASGEEGCGCRAIGAPARSPGAWAIVALTILGRWRRARGVKRSTREDAA